MRCVISCSFHVQRLDESLALHGAPKYNDFYILVGAQLNIVNKKITFVIFPALKG